MTCCSHKCLTNNLWLSFRLLILPKYISTKEKKKLQLQTQVRMSESRHIYFKNKKLNVILKNYEKKKKKKPEKHYLLNHQQYFQIQRHLSMKILINWYHKTRWWIIIKFESIFELKIWKKNDFLIFRCGGCLIVQVVIMMNRLAVSIEL